MRIRTAIFGVYVVASAIGLAAVMALVLRDVRLRYVESMRRTLGDTAALLVTITEPGSADGDWTKPLREHPPQAELLRVFACAPDGRVLFDAAGRDVGQVYHWSMIGGGRFASKNYSVANVAQVGDELRVMAPVQHHGAIIGWVGVGRPLAAVSDGVRAARVRLVVYTSAIAIGMIVAGWWIATRLTHSLERLTAYARSVPGDRRAVPPQSRAKEIAELGQAFEEMRDALEGRQHVERYTQTLAHEVKAPLAAIRGAAELLDENMPPEQRRKFLGNIRTESARIQRIIERLLELSSLEARKALRQTVTLSSGQLAAEAADVVRAAGAGRDVTVTVRPGGEAALRGEGVLLREALVNLLQNAVEFSPAGGEVTLAVEADAGRVSFVVEDAGPGVPEYALPQVFDRFYSLPRPGSAQKSTGLGLALVREIAHLHGGEATLANRAEGGARATLTLPTETGGKL